MRSELVFAGLALLLSAPACISDGPSGDNEPDGGAIDGSADGPVDPTIDAAPLDGSPPDAPATACTEEGATRVADCGNCGTRSEICQDGAWTPQSACLGEGECAAASVETGPAPLCGEQQRLCGMDCTWGDWFVTMPGTGACEPGSARRDQADCAPGFARDQICSSACVWENAGECIDECGGLPRTTPADSEEICLPAGTFIRGATSLGSSDLDWSTPIREVYVSAHYIDRYSVTCRRFQECIDAGGCAVPASPFAVQWLADPTLANHPITNLTWDEARTFCAWDGRRLLTEAEWERAARGPAPRENWYTWDGNDFRCDLYYAAYCGYVPAPTAPCTDPYDSLPGVRSYYGVDLLMGGGMQWVSDWFDPDYYDLAESLVDPVGPASGTDHAKRGSLRCAATDLDRVTKRDFGGHGSIRCGRDAVAP